jgi:hypothetical protein
MQTNGIVKPVIVQAIVAVIAAAILGATAVVWNWVSAGGVIHALGGVTLPDVIQKLTIEVVSGKWSGNATKMPDGTFEAAAYPALCPKGTVLVNAYCWVKDQQQNNTSVNLRRVGLDNNESGYYFHCAWNVSANQNTFEGQAQAVCLGIVEK